MGRDIFITCYLNEKFNDLIIKNILIRSLSLGVKMYAYSDETLFDAPPIDIEVAIRRIMNREDEAPVLCSFEDTSFFLYFTKADNGNCELSLGCTNYPWKKEFGNGKKIVEFDLPRYIRLMLQIVYGLKLQKIEAYIHWT